MTNNTGKEYESLTEEVFKLLTANESYTSVEKDILIESPDGSRQFDVVLKTNIADMEIVTVVECKDWNKNINVTVVDGLVSKMEDVKANKAAIVAKKGFTKGAIKKATRLGVELYTVRDIDRNIAELGFQIPILFTILENIDYKTSASLSIPPAGSISINEKPKILIDEVPIEDYIFKKIIEQEIQIDDFAKEINLETISSGVYAIDVSGGEIELSDYEINYILEGEYYFGYVEELPNTIGVHNFTNNKAKVFLNENDILYDYKKNLTKYSNKVDVPDVGYIGVVVFCKSFTVQSSSIDLDFPSTFKEK